MSIPPPPDGPAMGEPGEYDDLVLGVEVEHSKFGRGRITGGWEFGQVQVTYYNGGVVCFSNPDHLSTED